MAGQRLTDKTALEEQLGSGDLLMVVDVNDTTGSAEGTSKKYDAKFLMQTDKFSLSNAEIKALDSTPKTLVGALSGYYINVFSFTMFVTYASSTESSSKDLHLTYDTSNTSVNWTIIRDCMNGKTTDITFVTNSSGSSNGACATSILNKPFMMSASGAFNGGWTADVYVTYNYVKVL
tara:strand:- start:489 stop:1019 length:531 start_codon:yes stop_codon:yes gene_type:complete